MAESSTANPEGENSPLTQENETESPVIITPSESPVNNTSPEIDALLLEARQRRARVRAKKDEIITQLSRNDTTDTKDLIAWGIAFALVAIFIYSIVIKFI